ncbi:MAG: hypothetical protein ACJA07_000436 [Rhodococcus sp. (in: high G+C Gram-positive bacteria)]|jgi:hypothetical protein
MRRPAVHLEPTEPGSRVLGIELAFDEQGGTFYIGLWVRQVIVLWSRRRPTPVAIVQDVRRVEDQARRKAGR